jgi:hypothetical protein
MARAVHHGGCGGMSCEEAGVFSAATIDHRCRRTTPAVFAPDSLARTRGLPVPARNRR